MKQGALSILAYLSSFIAVCYAASTKSISTVDSATTKQSPASNFPLTREGVISLHHSIKDHPDQLKQYEAFEETPRWQEKVFKFCQVLDGLVDNTVCSPTKTANNLLLADQIFTDTLYSEYQSLSTTQTKYKGNFANPLIHDELISDVYKGKTSPNSGLTLEKRRLIAHKMLKYALLLPKDVIGKPLGLFSRYLEVADVEHIRSLCLEIFNGIPVTEASTGRQALQPVCFAMIQNPNMHMAFVQPWAFDIGKSDFYKKNGFCADEELREIMIVQLNSKDTRAFTFDSRELLNHKLRNTDFDKIVTAFKQFAKIHKKPLDPSSEKDQIALDRLLFTSLKDKALGTYQIAKPEEIKAMLSRAPLDETTVHIFIKFLDYKPYNYLEIYKEITESEGRQVELYELFLSANTSYYHNLLTPMKLKTNLLLARLIFSDCIEEKLKLLGNFPRVRDLLISKEKEREREEEKKGKEEDHEEGKEEDNEEGENVGSRRFEYGGNFFAKCVDHRIFSDVYRSKIGEQEVGKPLALAMLRNAFKNYNGEDNVLEHIYSFAAVVDANDVSQLCQIITNTADTGGKLKDLKTLCGHLQKNPNYIVALVQPKIFRIEYYGCFTGVKTCTDNELRDIAVATAMEDCTVEEDGHIPFILQNLRFPKLVELLKKVAVSMGNYIVPSNNSSVLGTSLLRSWDFRSWDFLNDPKDPFRELPLRYKNPWGDLHRAIQKSSLLIPKSDWEGEQSRSVDFKHPLINQPWIADEWLTNRWLTKEWTRANLKAISASKSERQVFLRITNRNVVRMIANEYGRLPRGCLTDNFAVNILNWVLEQFLQKFPDHFLAPILKQIKPDSVAERWLFSLAKWYNEYNGGHTLPNLTKENSLLRSARSLIMSGSVNVDSTIRAQIVAETAEITDLEKQQLVTKALAKYSNDELLGMFQKLPRNPGIQFFVVQPHLFPTLSPGFTYSGLHDFLTQSKKYMKSKYVVNMLERSLSTYLKGWINILKNHKKLFRWNSQEDWADLERILIQNDPHCYEAVKLRLSIFEQNFLTEIPFVDCSLCTSFKEVEAAVLEKVKPILRERLEFEYAKKYGNVPLLQVADPNLMAFFYFNRKLSGSISEQDQDQDYKVAIVKAFLDKLEIVSKARKELEERADLVIQAISDWYGFRTESKFSMSAGLSSLKKALESCWLYVLLTNEIIHGLDVMAYQQLLEEAIDGLFRSSDTGIRERVVEHYQDLSELGERFKASLRDPVAKIAMIQPWLNVPEPWSLADIRAIISEKVPIGIFRARLMIAPASLLFRAFNGHMLETKRFFDPESIADWKLFESLMIKRDQNCGAAVIKVSNLPFNEGLSVKCQDFDSYQKVFNIIREANGLGKEISWYPASPDDRMDLGPEIQDLASQLLSLKL